MDKRRKESQHESVASETALEALIEVACRAPGPESRRLLKEALDGYAALASRGRSVLRSDRARLLMAVSDAARLLVPQVEGKQRRRTLEREISALREAASVFTKARIALDEADARYRLGNALIELAELSSDETSVTTSNAAVNEFRAGLAIDGLPGAFCALLHDGVGRALRDQCRSLTGRASLDRVTEAEEEFMAALCCIDGEEEIELVVQVSNNLAGTLACKADHLRRRERAACMREAVRAFKVVAELYDPEEAPEDFAMAQHNLASALVDQAQQLTGRRREAVLERAQELYQVALGIYTRASYPSAHINSLRCLANVLYERALDKEGSKRRELLSEAWRMIERAQRRHEEEADELVSVCLYARGRIAIALAKEEGRSKQRLSLLEEADSAFETAIGHESVTSSPDFYADLVCASAEPLVERGRAVESAAARPLLQEAVRRAMEAMDMADVEHSPARHAEAQWMLASALITMDQHGLKAPEGLPASGAAAAKSAIAAFRDAGYVAEAARCRSKLRRFMAPN